MWFARLSEIPSDSAFTSLMMIMVMMIMKDIVTFVTTENAENAESPENDRLVGSTRDHLDPVGVLSRKEPGRLEL